MITDHLKLTRVSMLANSPLLAALAGFIVLFADVISKYLTQLYLPLKYSNSIFYPYGGIGVFKNFLGVEFSIIHATNRGAAWGVLADFQIYLLILRIAMIVGLVSYLIFKCKRPDWQIPLCLIIAGAIGNILDFFVYGHVVDMFHFILWGYDYPVFNVADSAIFIGVFWLLISSFFEKSSSVE